MEEEKKKVTELPSGVCCGGTCWDCEHMDQSSPSLTSLYWCEVYKTYYKSSQSAASCKYYMRR